MADSLVFELQPRGETLTFRALIESAESINRILRDVDYALTGSKQGRQWLVTKLSNPRPTLTLEPMLDEAGLVDATANGIRVITSDADIVAPPPGWTDFALNDLRNMKRLFSTRGQYAMRRVAVRRDTEPVGNIGDDIERKVNRVFRGEYHLLGSLEGTLERVNLHGQPTITIWDRVTHKPVRVHLTKDLRGRVGELLEHRVLVVGRVNYFANGTPRSIVDLTDIEDLDARTHIHLADFGSVPDLTGDQSTEEFLKAMRE